MTGLLGEHFVRDLIVFLFAVSGGVTLSAIIANLYQPTVRKPQSKAGTALHYAIMALAGPTVLLENATRLYRKENCSNLAYVIAVAVSGYWAYVIGMGMLTAYAAVK